MEGVLPELFQEHSYNNRLKKKKNKLVVSGIRRKAGRLGRENSMASKDVDSISGDFV